MSKIIFEVQSICSGGSAYFVTKKLAEQYGRRYHTHVKIIGVSRKSKEYKNALGEGHYNSDSDREPFQNLDESIEYHEPFDSASEEEEQKENKVVYKVQCHSHDSEEDSLFTSDCGKDYFFTKEAREWCEELWANEGKLNNVTIVKGKVSRTSDAYKEAKVNRKENIKLERKIRKELAKKYHKKEKRN